MGIDHRQSSCCLSLNYGRLKEEGKYLSQLEQPWIAWTTGMLKAGETSDVPCEAVP